MDTQKIKILLLEDDAAHAEAIRRTLKTAGSHFEIQIVGSLREFRQSVKVNPPDVALMDMVLPDGNALELLDSPPEMTTFPVLILTSHGNELTAVAAMKRGAMDYIVKSPEAFAGIPRLLTQTLSQWHLIQESKRMERELFLEGQILTNLSEGVNFVRLSDLNIIYTNPKFDEMFGYTGGELIGKPVSVLNAPSESGNQEIAENIQRYVIKNGEWHGETYNIRKDGSYFWCLVNISIFTHPIHGKAAVSVHQEITKRKRSEEAVKRSESKYKELSDSISDIFFAMDKELRYTYWNKASEKLTGIPVQDALGKSLTEIFPDSEATRTVKAGYLRAMDTQQPQHFTVEYPGGQNIIHEISAYPTEGGVSVFVKDITERRRVETALIESEERFRQVSESAGEIIWEVDADGLYRYLSRAVEKILGYTPGELIGKKHFYDLFTPDCQEEMRKAALAAFKERQPFQGFVNPNVHKDGSTVILETNGVPMLDKDGRLQGYRGADTDITERKQAEDSLRESEQFNIGLLDHSPNPIYVINNDTSINYVNPAFVKLTGFALDELIGKIPPYPWWPIDRQAEYSSSQQHYKLGTGHRDERLYQKKNGDKLWIDTNVSVVGENQSKYFIANWVDITERKKGEEALKRSEEFNTILRENSPAPMIAINPDYSVTYVNPAFEKLTGFSASEVLGTKPPFPWWIQEDVEHPDRIFKISPTSYFYGMERHMRSKSGEDFWVELSAVPVIINGEFKFHLSNWVDITERKKAEKERRQLEEKAQIASRLAAVGGMAAGIAHEINNPLTGVLGFSKLLLEKENLPEELKEDLKVIADGSQRVADIVRRLLTFARQTKPVRTAVNLNELIENTLKLREYVLKTANIEVVTRFDLELPWSMVDPGQLQQVFLNLIINAEYAMKEAHGKGTLVITTERLGNNIRLSFQDDGPGIAKEALEHLFQPFFTTKAPGEGTGLGLSLSRSIVLEHGGEMHVESEPGQGASFIIEIPIIEVLSPEVEVPSPVANVKPAGTQKGRILVVDDEPGVRELIEKVLIQTGYRVDTSGDAKEALDKLTGTKYDALLVDVRMPGMSGIELYARLQEKVPALVNRIIFITGDVMGIDVKAFLTQNSLAYLAKPFDIQVLKEKVDRIMKADQPENESPDRKGT